MEYEFLVVILKEFLRLVLEDFEMVRKNFERLVEKVWKMGEKVMIL